MSRPIVITIRLVGWALIIAAIVLPACALIVQAANADSIRPNLLLDHRQVGLLSRSAELAAVSTLVALLLSLPPAHALGTGKRGRSLLVALTLVPLLTPPYIYAYSWGLLTAREGLFGEALHRAGVGAWLQGEPLAAWVLGAWLWPICALIIGAGWRSVGRAVFDLAIIDTGRAQAFVRVGLPLLRGHVAAAAAIVFVLSLIEFTVPHLNSVMVYATELFARADQLGVPAGQVLWQSWPFVVMVAMAGIVLVIAIRSMQAWGPEDPSALGGGRAARPGVAGLALLSAVVGLTVVAPLAALLWQLEELSSVASAAANFAWHWRDSALIALAVAAAAIPISLAAGDGRAGRCTLVLAGLLAIIPAAVLGQTVVASVIGLTEPGRLTASAGAIYDRTPIVQCVALLARFVFFPLLVVRMALRRQPAELIDQAQSDGASQAHVLALVRWPAAAPAVLTGALLVLVLVLPEVAISSLTRNARTSWLAFSLFNHMHYGRDDAVIGTCLLMIVPVVLAAWAVHASVLRRHD